MFKKLTVLTCLALMLNACYKYNAPKKPENLISKQKMAYILIDLRLIQSVTGNNKKVLDSNNVKPAQYVYKKYNIDSLQFALSNNYYAFHVSDYEDIYTVVNDSLQSLREKYNTLIEEEVKAKRIADSLTNLEKIKKQKSKDSLIKGTQIENIEIDDIEMEDLEGIEF